MKLNLKGPIRQVSSRPRQRRVPRITIFALAQTVSKVEPKTVMIRPLMESKIKACPHVASAKAIFPSHSGIAFSAKVSLKDDVPHLVNDHPPARLDNLFICDACDAGNVQGILQGSGEHTEEHHLIRCLAPEKEDDEVSPTEQRLTLIEGRLDDMQTKMQTQWDDLTGQLNGLNARMGNIEQLLLRLAGAPGNVA